MSRCQSFTEKRRARLARRIAQLDALETRNTITESLWSLGLGIGFSAPAAAIGAMAAGHRAASPVGSSTPLAAHLNNAHHTRWFAQRVHVPERGVAATRSAATVEISAGRKPVAHTAMQGDWLTLAVTHTHKQRHHLKAAIARHALPGQAGSSSLSRGGVTTVARGAITPLRVAAPSPPQADPSSAMVTAALISSSTSSPLQTRAASTAPATSGGACPPTQISCRIICRFDRSNSRLLPSAARPQRRGANVESVDSCVAWARGVRRTAA